MYVWLIALFTSLAFLCPVSYGQDLKYIKLKGPLKERAQLLKSYSAIKQEIKFKSKSVEAKQRQQHIQARLQSNTVKVLKGIKDFDPASLSNSHREAFKSFSSDDDAFGGENSPIYDVLLSYLGPKHEDIGQTQAGNLLDARQEFDLGQKNFAGFSWQKPMGYFDIDANRQVVPDLFNNNRWMVTDTFTLTIDATSYLKQAQQEDLVEVSDQQIGAFAGIVFKRTYKYVHFTNSYEEGISSDFSKLFLGFLRFRLRNVDGLETYEQISKEDQLSIKAGAVATIPAGTIPVSVSAGVMVTFDSIGEVNLQRVAPEERTRQNEFLRVSMSKERSLATGVNLSLQLDFMNLIQLHLFSFDFEYELERERTLNLSFTNEDRDWLESNNDKSKEFQKILRLRMNQIDKLKRNIVSHEERKNQMIKSRYNVFHVAELRKQDTEVVSMTKNGITKTFMRHRNFQSKVQQNFFSRLFGGFFAKLFKIKSRPKIQRSHEKILTVEYEALSHLENSTPSRKPASVKEVTNEEKLSFNFEHEFYVKKIKGWWRNRSRRKTVNHLKNLTPASSDIVTAVKKQKLLAPITARTSIYIGPENIRYFFSQRPKQIVRTFADICNRKRRCYKKLSKTYSEIIKEKIKNKKIPLKSLRKLLNKIHTKVSRIRNLKKLFGNDIFINGNLSARTNRGHPFNTYFRSGTFRGLGVIDQNRR
ncbi:MAG: hypothetical protein ACOCUH_00080 [Bacteriovoracia bacterium]